MNSKVYYSKVGEANVVQMMRSRKGIIGGEGNGGVIYPSFHAGRDCLVAAGLTLSLLADKKMTLSELVETFPRYYNIKTKARLNDVKAFEKKLKLFEKDAAKLFGKYKVDRRDGLRFDFQQGWLQIRKSNTEPIFRLIVETKGSKLSKDLVDNVIRYFK